MGVIVSAILFAKEDIQGNHYTDGYILWEFRDTGYSPGGEVMDLTNYFSRVEHIEAFPASGALEYTPRANYGDQPHNAGSGRMQAWYLGSGILTLNISGLPIQILSGNISNLSGLGGLPGGATIASGRLGVVGSGAFNAGIAQVEILSGTAISGARAKLYVLGY